MAYSSVRMPLSRSNARDDHNNETAGDDPLRARNKRCSVQRAKMQHFTAETATHTMQPRRRQQCVKTTPVGNVTSTVRLMYNMGT